MTITSTRRLPKKPKGRPLKYTNELPDQRPCPSWCWILTSNPDGFAHDTTDVDPAAPFEVDHHTHGFYKVTASKYGADVAEGRTVTPATLELNLAQLGQSDPRIDVALRHDVWVAGKGTQQEYDDERRKLSIGDARELVVMLEHVIGLSELPAV